MDSLAIVIVTIIIGILIILFVRELVCWYLKINKMHDQLEELNENSKVQINVLNNIEHLLSDHKRDEASLN